MEPETLKFWYGQGILGAVVVGLAWLYREERAERRDLAKQNLDLTRQAIEAARDQAEAQDKMAQAIRDQTAAVNLAMAALKGGH